MTQGWVRYRWLILAAMLLLCLGGYVYARYVFEPGHSPKCLVKIYGTVYLEAPTRMEPSYDLVITVIDTKELGELSSAENIDDVTLTGPNGTVTATGVSVETRPPLMAPNRIDGSGSVTSEVRQYWLRLVGLNLDKTTGPVTVTGIEIQYKDGLTEVYELGEVTVVPEWPEGYFSTSRVPFLQQREGNSLLLALRADPWTMSWEAGPGLYAMTQMDAGAGQHAFVDSEGAFGIVMTRKDWESLEENLYCDWRQTQAQLLESLDEPLQLWISAEPSGTLAFGLPVSLSCPTGFEQFVLRPAVKLQGPGGREVVACQDGPSSLLQLRTPISYEDCVRMFELGWTYSLRKR